MRSMAILQNDKNISFKPVSAPVYFTIRAAD